MKNERIKALNLQKKDGASKASILFIYIKQIFSLSGLQQAVILSIAHHQ